MGTGFAFLSNQYHLNVGGDDFISTFYSKPSLVIKLKIGEFRPEYADQLNFYLSAIDDILKKDNNNPSIGLLLCKSKNALVAESALKNMSKPIGVIKYKVIS